MTGLIYIGLLFSLCLVASIPARSALRPNHFMVDTKLNNFVSKGVFIGGKEMGAASLLNVSIMKSRKSEKERVIIDLGDSDGNQLTKDVSYFHAVVESTPPRLVVNLANVQKTALREEEVKAGFVGSAAIEKVSLTMDPIDHSTTLILDFKNAKSVSAFTRPNAPGRIFIEIRP